LESAGYSNPESLCKELFPSEPGPSARNLRSILADKTSQELADRDILARDTLPASTASGSYTVTLKIQPPPEPSQPPHATDFVGREAELTYFAGKLATGIWQ